MSVRCNRCDEVVPIEEVDEFTPPDQEYGIEIAPEILDGDKAHIWKEKNGNLYIHYPEGDTE
jgi:hypothetical protein